MDELSQLLASLNPYLLRLRGEITAQLPLSPEQLDMGLGGLAAILLLFWLSLRGLRKRRLARLAPKPAADALPEGAKLDEAQGPAEEAEEPPSEALEATREATKDAEPEQAPEQAAEPASKAPEPEEAPEEPPASQPAAKPMREGLQKTRQGFMSRLNAMIFGQGLDEELADDLETLLVTSDIGIRTSEQLLKDLRGQLSRRELASAEAVRSHLEKQVRAIVDKPVKPLLWEEKPKVIMVIGVNGVGKTTTIGKLAARLTRSGKKVVLGAGDTFRAAAVEQLEVWGERAGAEVVKGQEGQDPASVVFDAVSRAKQSGADVCICDTAGRLHTKVNLMEELKKLRRVMDKACPGAPHEVLLVLDATTGQNGISQAKQFKAAVNVDSIALTKLDGTAKGGVVVAICHELDVPVRFVGIGEQVDDLRDFVASEFVDALFEAN